MAAELIKLYSNTHAYKIKSRKLSHKAQKNNLSLKAVSKVSVEPGQGEFSSRNILYSGALSKQDIAKITERGIEE